MNLREELEILRGKPIKVCEGDPIDIPCIETSDAEKLCKHPVVSVHMLTYNHESYIRQAIEGVMMQKTDFEFELVIGEDASTDTTREICFEYQKRYPDKIRVLWWHENLRKVQHPSGGNSNRVMAHCRGEFIAFCEGDDYWIDPLKLQKQVDVMRQNPSVGFCFCNARVFYQKTEKTVLWNIDSVWESGLIAGRKFTLLNIFGLFPAERNWPASTFIMTASVMYRKASLDRARRENEIFYWKLMIGDSVTWLGLASVSDAYYLDDVVSVYRINPTGLTSSCSSLVILDTDIVRLYYFQKAFNRHIFFMPRSLFFQVLLGFLFYNQMGQSYICQLKTFCSFLNCTLGRSVLLRLSFLPFLPFVFLTGVRQFWRNILRRYYCYIFDAATPSKWLINEYAHYGIIAHGRGLGEKTHKLFDWLSRIFNCSGKTLRGV